MTASTELLEGGARETPENGARKLPPVRRKATRVSQESLVTTGFVTDGASLPLLVTPAAARVDLAAWAEGNRGFVDETLRRHGAILFRDFGVESADEFGRVVRAMSGELLEYRERSSPRHEVAGRVYTSTDYPAAQSIFPHNENSYQTTWPLKIFFYCETPPASGGETPLADTRKVYARLRPETRRRFEEQGCMYVRNYGGGLGLDWRTVFQTEDRAEVEAYCRRSGIEFEWKDGNRLRTRQVRPAIARHPQTGEPSWFNHAAFFHVSTLEPAIRDGLLGEFAPEDLPNNTYYGDGTEIEPEVLEELRAAYAAESVAFAWRRGDVLAVDNMLTAHARRPYSGERKVLVAMAEPFGDRGTGGEAS